MNSETARHKVHLTGAQETLLITLYAKALDSRSDRSLLHDETADDIVRAVDYDFARTTAFGDSRITVIRAAHYDAWVRSFLGEHPDAVVVYLGCGLDTRVTRINPPASVQWFDIDYPDVISVRENFFHNRPGYTMVGSSITDPLWLARVPTGRPTIVIAEGCLEYLSPEEVGELLGRLTERFGHGRIAFDVLSPNAIRAGQKQLAETMRASHKWAVDNLREVEDLNPKLKLVEAVSVFRSPYIRKLPFGPRLFFRMASLMPGFSKLLRVLLYEF